MNRNDAHELARILQGPDYDGKLIDSLVDAVTRAERSRGTLRSHIEADPNEGYYRVPGGFLFKYPTGGPSRLGEELPVRVDTIDTPSTPACSVLEADNCEHCHAAYGHKAWCPTLNRDVAEAISALNGNASEAEKIRARALGVRL